MKTIALFSVLMFWMPVLFAGEASSAIPDEKCIACKPIAVEVRSAKGVPRAAQPISITSVTAFGDLTIAKTDTVTWTNNQAGATHTSTSDNGSAQTWDSGNLATGNSFPQTFNNAGKFPYHCSIHSATMKGNIIVPPATPTAGNGGAVCAGQTLNLTASSTETGPTFNWTGPNSFTSNQQNPSISNVTTDAGGTYSVTVTVNGATSAAATTTATVNPGPNAPTAGNNGPIVETQTLNLTASTIATATYSWTGPNGFTSNQQNPSISPASAAAAGTYSVTVNVSGCTSSSASTTAQVVANAAPTISNNGPLCVGQTLQLTVGQDGGSYSWSGPNGYTSTVQNPSIANVKVADGGFYSVVVTINGFALPTAQTNVLVSNPMAPQVTVEPNVTPSSPTVGQSVQLSATFTSCGSYEVTWDFGDGTTGTGSTVTHAFSPATNFAIKVTAVDTNNLTTTRNLTLKVEPATLPGTTGSVASHTDSDGDGFSDELENGAHSSTTSISDTPFGTAPAGTPQDLGAVKLAISLNFAKQDSDSITLSGTLPVPDGFVLDKQKLILDVGGVIRVFRFTSKGQAKTSFDTAKLTVRATRGVVKQQSAKFSAKFIKSTFQNSLSNFGLTGDVDLKLQERSVDLNVVFNQVLYQVSAPQLYTAKAKKTGKTKSP